MLAAQTATLFVDVDRVQSVYSGRPGCMCGCRGKHSYASAHRRNAQRDRGYAITDDEVSDRSVSIIVRSINKAIEDNGPYGTDEVEIEINSDYVCVESATRVWCAYFVK